MHERASFSVLDSCVAVEDLFRLRLRTWSFLHLYHHCRSHFDPGSEHGQLSKYEVLFLSLTRTIPMAAQAWVSWLNQLAPVGSFESSPALSDFP